MCGSMYTARCQRHPSFSLFERSLLRRTTLVATLVASFTLLTTVPVAVLRMAALLVVSTSLAEHTVSFLCSGSVLLGTGR